MQNFIMINSINGKMTLKILFATAALTVVCFCKKTKAQAVKKEESDIFLADPAIFIIIIIIISTVPLKEIQAMDLKSILQKIWNIGK